MDTTLPRMLPSDTLKVGAIFNNKEKLTMNILHNRHNDISSMLLRGELNNRVHEFGLLIVW
jgi:hypothetical protein